MLHNAGDKQRKGVQESVFIKHVLKIINQDVSLENLENDTNESKTQSRAVQ